MAGKNTSWHSRAAVFDEIVVSFTFCAAAFVEMIVFLAEIVARFRRASKRLAVCSPVRLASTLCAFV